MDDDSRAELFIEKCTIRNGELNLDYPPTKGIDGLHPMILPGLNKRLQAYSLVEKLTVTTDFFYQLPEEFKLFENVKELTITGSRWWNLTCENLPVSTERLVLWEQSNLNQSVMIGSERLTNLREIVLDWKTFFTFDNYNQYQDITPEEGVTPIAKLPNLRQISFLAGEAFHENEMDSDWQKRVASSPLFNNYFLNLFTQKQSTDFGVDGLDKRIDIFL